MNDLISRQAAIDDIETVNPSMPLNVNWVKNWVKTLPSAQPEGIKCGELSEEDYEKMAELMRKQPPQWIPTQPEIIRCKDCEYHGYNECFHKLGLMTAFDNNFCSYAERRTDGGYAERRTDE